MKSISLMLLILLATPLFASAQDDELGSRGLQQAKRVVSLENQSDLPSRAYWLSRRCIKNSKKNLSFQNATQTPSTQKN